MDIFPSHIRAYFFLLIAFGLAFVFQYIFLRRQVFSFKWVVLWASITGVAFISKNIWILILFMLFLSVFVLPKKGNERIAYYFALLPMLPTFAYEIPGLLPGIRFLFNLTYPRMLSLLILLPLFVRYIRQPTTKRAKLFNSRVDKLTILYIILLLALGFRTFTITSGLRTDLYILLDIFLPYFVISRYINTIEDIKQVFVAILFSAIMLSFVGLFEVRIRWDFYGYLRELLDFLPSSVGQWYHSRGGNIRIRTTMNPIPFGYFIALAIGCYLYLKDQFSLSKLTSIATLTLLSSVLFYTGSRGAWLATIFIVMVYLFLNIRSPQIKMGAVLLTSAFFAGFLFIGGTPSYEDQTGTFNYRIQLITNSLNVIAKHPVFGTFDPNADGALEVMRQGQGIIDIVNTYIQVALHAGITGFILFSSIFIVLLLQLYKANKQLRRQRNQEAHAISSALIAMMLATIVFIGTVSSITYIPIYYWSIIAICSAYIRIISPARNRQNARPGNAE